MLININDKIACKHMIISKYEKIVCKYLSLLNFQIPAFWAFCKTDT